MSSGPRLGVVLQNYMDDCATVCECFQVMCGQPPVLCFDESSAQHGNSQQMILRDCPFTLGANDEVSNHYNRRCIDSGSVSLSV